MTLLVLLLTTFGLLLGTDAINRFNQVEERANAVERAYAQRFESLERMIEILEDSIEHQEKIKSLLEESGIVPENQQTNLVTVIGIHPGL